MPRPSEYRKRSIIERLERYTTRPNGLFGCWEWVGPTDGKGYGKLAITRDRTTHTYRAHRLSYELHVAPIPDGLVIDHLCRNHGCVNPAHLEPVTNWENTVRGISPIKHNPSKTHCPQGHPYDEANTKRYRGKRYCRECQRTRCLSYYYARKNQGNVA